MLNRDQYPRAADEIWLQLGSPPAQGFNHQVNQELGAQKCQSQGRAAGPGADSGHISLLGLIQLSGAVSSRKPELLLTPRSESMLELQLY